MVEADALIQINVSTFLILIFAIVNVLVLGPLAWIVKSAIDEQKNIKQSHSDFKEYAHKEFVRKSDYETALHEIKTLLDRIFDKLDGKADK